MYQVYLKKNEEKRIQEGHPWVYANEVARIDGKGKNGEVANVYTFDGKFLGKGFINHFSKILVRIMSYDIDQPIDEEFFFNRITLANNLRTHIGYEDNYRVVFAEADDLPALIVDKYADVLCVQLLSLGMSNSADMIVNALVKIFNPAGIFERSDVAVRAKEGLPLVKRVLYGSVNPVTINENGIRMLVDIPNGQKTGYYLDQKENRLALRRYAKGRTVLDCFANVGGFALNCAYAGAKSVTAVDISQLATQTIEQNATLNGLKLNAVCADVFDYLSKERAEGKRYDLIVLDPPAFTKSSDTVDVAYRGYLDINLQALRLLDKGGILATASCSHFMTMPLFERMLGQASVQAGKRNVRILERRIQSPDHPTRLNCDETLYLKFYILQID